MADRPPVLGCLERLDDTRIVFLGQRADRPEVFYLGFRNSDGEDTKLIVSPEAMAAIARLIDRLPTVSPANRDRFPETIRHIDLALDTDQRWHWVVNITNMAKPVDTPPDDRV